MINTQIHPPLQGLTTPKKMAEKPASDLRTAPPAKMKASIKAKYATEKSNAIATLTANAGDVKLRASMTDATLFNGPSIVGLAFAVDKPGSFVLHYDVPKKDVNFRFTNSIRISEMPLNLSYSHMWRENRTAVDGTLVVDPGNKVSASYTLGTRNCKVKYAYVHGGATTFEPSYDVSSNAWDFAVSRKVYDEDQVRMAYGTSSKVLGMEWARISKTTGSFKVLASLNLGEKFKAPKLSFESAWDIDI